ncbi:MAG: hypothetical protein IPP74_14780 [Alphaproteobacteria bacterium]|nr:hypothetical protein [Alphaproteobacteria bacterium]
MNIIAAITVLLIGTVADIKNYERMYPKANITVVDHSARVRFRKFGGQYRRALWAARAERVRKRLHVFPRVMVILGRESLPGTWDGGCAIGSTAVCDYRDLRLCNTVVVETSCRGLK